MTVTKVRKLSNPHGKKRRNPKAKAKKRLSPKQIKFFGTARQRAALKRRRKPATRRAAKQNPVKTVKRRKARRNPAHMITLGFINPQRKGTGRKMAKRTKKRNPAAPKRRRRNTTARKAAPKRRRRNSNIVMMAPTRRRRTGRRAARRNPSRRTRRNPMPGGGGKGTLELVLGGLGGVMVGKYVSNMPALSMLTSSPIGKAMVAGVSGYVAGYAVSRFAGQKGLGEGVTLGGLLEAVAIVATNYIPGIGGNIGLGDFVPAQFAVPQNVVTAGQRQMMLAAAAAAPAKGVGAIRAMQGAFGGAF